MTFSESLWQQVHQSSTSSVEAAIATVEDSPDSDTARDVIRTLIQEHIKCIYHVAASRNRTHFFSAASGQAPNPQILWRDLVGLDAPRAELVQLHNPDSAVLTPIRVILHGPPGTGKSLLALSFANARGGRVFPIQTARMQVNLPSELEKTIIRLFEGAAKSVFMRRNKSDGSSSLDPGATSILIESCDRMGVQRLEWTSTEFAFDVISSPSEHIPIKLHLALSNRKWTSNCVFIEDKSDKSKNATSSNYLLLSPDLTQYLPYKFADSLIKSTSPSLLWQNGFRLFSVSSGGEHVSPRMCVLVTQSCQPDSWKVSTYNKITPSLTSSKLSVALASSMYMFEHNSVFVPHFLDRRIPAGRIVVHRKDTDKIIEGNDAHIFVNGITSQTLAKFAFSVYVAAKSQDEIIPANSPVLCSFALKPFATQLEFDTSRFLIVDPEGHSNIGSLLLNKPIPFTTLKSITVQHTIGRNISDGKRVVVISLEAQANAFEFYGDTRFADDLVSSGKYLVGVECTSERDACSPLRKVIADTRVSALCKPFF
ncbi:hypothetical protein HDU81_003326 [Chytriomyces hyalinus]|nr:hypothetical protein HDU81_003326 [Chytriomyces hyalinus]